VYNGVFSYFASKGDSGEETLSDAIEIAIFKET